MERANEPGKDHDKLEEVVREGGNGEIEITIGSDRVCYEESSNQRSDNADWSRQINCLYSSCCFPGRKTDSGHSTVDSTTGGYG
jgi:hypothetical protein